ncbi:tRNA dihydrouridine synthase [Rhodotorula kratochvilovae]
MISHLHQHLATPVIAKIRVFPSLSKTLHYASQVYSSGAQLLAVHGRTREAKGQLAGFASWPKIKAVVDLISPKVPVLANGGCPGAEEIAPCLEETGAYGVLSAEGNLYNPMIFAPHNAAAGRAYTAQLPAEMRAALAAAEDELDLSGAGWDRDAAAYAPATFIAQQYLAIVRTLPSTQTATSAIKAHLYKLFRPVWAAGRHPELRESLGRCGGRGSVEYKERVQTFQDWVDQFRALLKEDYASGLLPPDSNRPLTHAEVQTLFGGVVPYSHCQPYLRVTKPLEPGEEAELRKADGEAKRKREVEEGTVTDPDAPPTQRARPTPPSPPPSSLPSLDAPAPPPAAPADSTAPAPSAAPASVACVHAAPHASACMNAAAAKCANGACRACCAALRGAAVAEGEGKEEEARCEFHEAKEAKAREAEERREKAKRERRAAGEKKARANEERIRREGEERRREREAAKKAGAAEVEGEKGEGHVVEGKEA